MAIVESQSFANSAAAWTGTPHYDVYGSDPNYPLMWMAENVKVVPGVGPSGQNVLEAFNTNVVGAGVWFHGGAWDLTNFDITVLVKPTADGLGEIYNYATVFSLREDQSTYVFALYYDVDIETFILRIQAPGEDTVVVSAASMLNEWQTFRFCGSASENNGWGAEDGHLTVIRNGQPLFDKQNIYLYGNGSASDPPLGVGYTLGFYGTLGQYTGIVIKDTSCVDPDPPEPSPIVVQNQANCCGTVPIPGASGPTAGGIPDTDPFTAPPTWVPFCSGGGLPLTAADPSHSEDWDA